MGSYREALALPVTTPDYPDIALTRRDRTNYGFVVNVEQAVTRRPRLFLARKVERRPDRDDRLDRRDQSLSLGVLLKGTAWGRPNDRIGLAGVIEGLSPEARAYFAAGGLGILIGDGRLNYRPEQVLETYYALQPQQVDDGDARLSVHRQPRLQRRPRSGVGVLATPSRGVLRRPLASR